ncbi:DUF2281 domain-containing protein [Gloeocapsopsis dulcis]|uniref:DUF2281 domain-containing protein n=1 Tax=Gloeocapsopsis dulcis AAB1 = 1H9 TaxID=1433147 RepID=A0A6N8FZY1_9CHRO|nr:DUF2281 domain-containing protein [Gloeocapsopsis dulcis]MUL37885.1 hypothetical protein [Gloeocapsopsis dulcis AAB1 = 1H9]WNN92308.1 DUF2281 domain-containing protein [Gloeocapsopsis dulcis]
MNAADRINELVKSLPTEQVNQILDFAEFLHQKQLTKSESRPVAPIPPGTLTGLRGIAKRAGQTQSDEELKADYTDYLSQKYQ